MIKIRTWWTQHYNSHMVMQSAFGGPLQQSLLWPGLYQLPPYLPLLPSPTTSATHTLLWPPWPPPCPSTHHVWASSKALVSMHPFSARLITPTWSRLTPFKSSFEWHLPTQVLMTTLSLLFCSNSTSVHLFTCLRLLDAYHYVSWAHIFICVLPIFSTTM